MLEEMPAFPDRESSLLNKLYETAPWTAKLHKRDNDMTSEENATTGGGITITVPNGITEPNIGNPVDPLISTSKGLNACCTSVLFISASLFLSSVGIQTLT